MQQCLSVWLIRLLEPLTLLSVAQFLKISYDLYTFHESISQLYGDVLMALNDFLSP